MEMTSDVAIIGSGPAGSMLAILLASRGVDVALIDRDEFPRDKLCGEFLSYDCLEILARAGILGRVESRGAPRIDRCTVVGSSRSYSFAFPSAARGISRMTFDALLVSEATARGAKIVAGRTVSNVDLSGPSPLLHLESKDHGSQLVRCRVAVGAWGRWGRLDRQLGRNFVSDHDHRSFGFKRHFRRAEPSSSEIVLHSFERGYLGVSAVEGNIVNICGLVHESRLSNLKGGWEGFVEMLRRERPELDRLFSSHDPVQEGYLSSEPVIFAGRDPVVDSIFMVGDASGVIDPLTGNGMAMGIQSALLAAPAIISALESGDGSAYREYRVGYHEMFSRRLRWSRRIAGLLSNPRRLDAALAIGRFPSIGGFLLGRTRARPASLQRALDRWFR